MARIPRDKVVAGVSRLTEWWIGQRLKKFGEMMHESMAVNPFMAPLLYELHFADDFGDLGSLLLGGHFMVGHATGFGKLIDEKILPEVFGAEKLSGGYRASHPPLKDSCFDDVDHLLAAAKPTLLSLKMSRWTIQLAASVQLNRAFHEILTKYPGKYAGIVVGVVYGKADGLTDKYDILRGINRGKNHAVHDLRQHVAVYSGREFWSWINGNEPATQEWVLEGILQGIKNANCRANAKNLIEKYTGAFDDAYEKFIDVNGKVDWKALLRAVNG